MIVKMFIRISICLNAHNHLLTTSARGINFRPIEISNPKKTRRNQYNDIKKYWYTDRTTVQPNVAH
jgi:hypothetical protein